MPDVRGGDLLDPLFTCFEPAVCVGFGKPSALPDSATSERAGSLHLAQPPGEALLALVGFLQAQSSAACEQCCEEQRSNTDIHLRDRAFRSLLSLTHASCCTFHRVTVLNSCLRPAVRYTRYSKMDLEAIPRGTLLSQGRHAQLPTYSKVTPRFSASRYSHSLGFSRAAS